MNVREALKRTKHWVDTEARRTPGFQGVYVAGSVARMSLDAALEPWRDVDLVLVTTDADALRAGHLELVHEGVIIECALHDASRFQSPENVLATPDQADNITVGIRNTSSHPVWTGRG